MEENTSKYKILTSEDFETISSDNDIVYSTDYIRQLLRGYVPKSKHNKLVFDKADKLMNDKLNQLKKDR